MPRPTLSVVVPVRDGAELLSAALSSVREEAGGRAEIVVVDDGSTDGSADVARRSGADTVVTQPARGFAPALDAGVAHASAGILGFVDADDLWVPGRLAPQLSALDGADLALGRLQYARRHATGWQPVGEPFHAFSLGTCLMTRAAVAAAGSFAAAGDGCEDIDWFLRARERGLRFAAVDALALVYRLHGGNRSAQLGDGAFVRALQRSLARRRAGGGRAADLPVVLPNRR